jgi:hypothetical protein
MVLRAIALCGLLLGLVAPAAMADEDQHHGDGQDQQAAATAGSFQFASGASGVTVTPPGGSAIQAVTCTILSGGWPAAISGSQWISPNADCSQAVATGAFTYTVTFTLPSGATNLGLTGSVLADDSVSITLNGTGVPISGAGGFAAASTFSTTSGFAPGATNTLTFSVNNATGASGLDFIAMLTGTGVGQANGNHGQCVSNVAHETEHGHGHGEAVHQAAHDCPNGGGNSQGDNDNNDD